MGKNKVYKGTTPKIKTGCGTLYVTVSENNEYISARLGKAGGCPSCFLDSLSYLVKLLCQKGATEEEVLKALKGYCCQNKNDNCVSCVDGLGKVLEKVWAERKEGET